MCSSWILFVTDSILCLVDSRASVIQLNLVFASDALAYSVFETTVSRYARLRKRLFYVALQLPLMSPTLPCILNDVFVFFVTRINMINSSQISGVFEFQFLDCSLLWAAFPILVQRSGHMWSGRDVVWHLSVYPRTTHVLLEEFRSVMWISWNLSTNLTDFYLSRHHNRHQLVFLVPHPNHCELPWWHHVFQWNWEWLFFWHV